MKSFVNNNLKWRNNKMVLTTQEKKEFEQFTHDLKLKREEVRHKNIMEEIETMGKYAIKQLNR